MHTELKLSQLDFTPDDIVLMRQIHFPLRKYLRTESELGVLTGHHDYLWEWIEARYYERKADLAGISLNEFVGVWRELPEDFDYDERKQALKDYVYARRYSDIEVRTLREMTRELHNIPGDYEHRLRESYVPLRRICWTHEQVMEMLQLVEDPDDIRYICQVARKGIWYEPIFEWISYGLDIFWLACGLRVPGIHPDDALDLVGLLLDHYRTDINSAFTKRTEQQNRERIKKALYDYKDDRRQRYMTHDMARSKALGKLMALA